MLKLNSVAFFYVWTKEILAFPLRNAPLTPSSVSKSFISSNIYNLLLCGSTVQKT